MSLNYSDLNHDSSSDLVHPEVNTGLIMTSQNECWDMQEYLESQERKNSIDSN